MKKILSIIVVMILCLNLLSLNVFAANPTVTVSGPQTVEKGQVVEIKVNFTATDIYGISGIIKYNENQLRLDGTVGGHNDLSVLVNPTNKKFMVWNNIGELLVDGTGTIVVFNFTVLETTTGSAISVAFENMLATDSRVDIPVSNANYSFTVVENTPTPTPPESSQPESSQPDSTESKPTESKPTESKPTESKPTVSKPTESKPTVSKPTQTDSVEPETNEPETSEPESDSTESKPDVQDKPLDPIVGDDEDEQKSSCWWWILVIIAVACWIWYLIVFIRKKKFK